MILNLDTCPFCGGKVTIYCTEKSNVYLFDHIERNPDCALLMPEVIQNVRSYDAAVASWNRRYDDA